MPYVDIRRERRDSGRALYDRGCSARRLECASPSTRGRRARDQSHPAQVSIAAPAPQNVAEPDRTCRATGSSRDTAVRSCAEQCATATRAIPLSSVEPRTFYTRWFLRHDLLLYIISCFSLAAARVQKNAPRCPRARRPAVLPRPDSLRHTPQAHRSIHSPQSTERGSELTSSLESPKVKGKG